MRLYISDVAGRTAITAGRAVDPDSLNLTDTDRDPIRIQGFDDQKLRNKNTAEIF